MLHKLPLYNVHKANMTCKDFGCHEHVQFVKPRRFAFKEFRKTDESLNLQECFLTLALTKDHLLFPSPRALLLSKAEQRFLSLMILDK